MFFRTFSRHSLILLVTVALVLTGCNVGAAPSPTQDINAINTAIVGTTVAQFAAQFTQTALAMPQATNTPLPTDTPVALPTFAVATENTGALPTVSFDATATSIFTAVPAFTQAASPVPPAATQVGGCGATFVADITYADGTKVKGGETLNKVWRVSNTGTCTWDDGFKLVYIGGSIGNDNVSNYTFKGNDVVQPGGTFDVGVSLNAPCAQGNQEGHWRLQEDDGYYFGTILSIYIVVDGKTGGCG